MTDQEKVVTETPGSRLLATLALVAAVATAALLLRTELLRAARLDDIELMADEMDSKLKHLERDEFTLRNRVDMQLQILEDLDLEIDTPTPASPISSSTDALWMQMLQDFNDTTTTYTATDPPN